MDRVAAFFGFVVILGVGFLITRKLTKLLFFERKRPQAPQEQPGAFDFKDFQQSIDRLAS